MRHLRNSSAGFTLVEMLAVVLIIAIVVTLTVGISSPVIVQSKVKKTRTDIKTIMAAVEAFRMATGDYPAAGGADPTANSRTLFNTLSGNDKSRALMSALPPDCTRAVGGNRLLMDAFDSPIRYMRNGAAGGGPLVESAGPDLSFSSTTDNIRSDE